MTVEPIQLETPHIKFTIKRHPTARKVTLRVTHNHGLVFVVPKQFNTKSIPDLILQNLDWIHKSLSEAETIKSKKCTALPSHISLQAVCELWTVDYTHQIKKRNILTELPDHRLMLHGNTQNVKACQKTLRTWLKKRASTFLSACVKECSHSTGLPYSALSIRTQKTRWGSCSPQGRISLNLCLLFLPPTLVRHVILHELAHTVHPNHSALFWKLLATFDPASKQNKLALKRAAKANWIPGWVLYA